jgi:phosphatidylinositol kinase/protein kinase (PI-3  family)
MPLLNRWFESQSFAAGDASEVLNERAMAVMRRMTDKLMGRDHILEGSSATAECDSVSAQVQRLIAQAISHENLCQSYIGWCPFVSRVVCWIASLPQLQLLVAA